MLHLYMCAQWKFWQFHKMEAGAMVKEAWIRCIDLHPGVDTNDLHMLELLLATVHK